MKPGFGTTRLEPTLRWAFWTGIIAGTTLLVFWNDLRIVINEGLVSEGYSQVLLLPFIAGYLVYRRREILDALQNLPDRRRFGDLWTVVGASLILTTFVVYFYSSQTTYALEWRLLTIPVFVSGAVMAIFGYRFWRVLAVPIAFLVFFEPYFVQFTNPYWQIIAEISAVGAHGLLALFGYSTTLTTTLTGPVIQTSNGAFDIGLGSSGLQTLVGYTLFAALVAYLFSGSVVKRGVLFVLGYPILAAINILRIAVIIALNTFVSQTAATIFHTTGGLFLVFVGTLLMLYIGQRWLRLGLGPSFSLAKSCSHRLRGERYCYQCGRTLHGRGPSLTRSRATGLFAVAAGALLLLSILSPAFAQSTALSNVDLGSQSPSALMQLVPNIPGWKLSFDYRDTVTQSALQEDAALIFTYQRNSTQTNQTQIIYAIVEIGTLYHTWQSSLITHLQNLGVPTATVLVNTDLKVNGTTSTEWNFFVFQRPGSTLTEAVLQWVFRAPFLIGGTYEERFVDISIYENVPALLSTGLITNSSDYNQVLDAYLPFGEAMTNLWAPGRSVTYIQLNFPPTFALIGVVAVPEALGVSGYLVGASSRRRKVKRILEGVASGDDIATLKAVRLANESGGGTIDEVTAELAKLRGTQPSAEEVALSLGRAAELGLVDPRVVERSGALILSWKLKDGAERYLGSPGLGRN